MESFSADEPRRSYARGFRHCLASLRAGPRAWVSELADGRAKVGWKSTETT
jgi:hypothetical protein